MRLLSALDQDAPCRQTAGASSGTRALIALATLAVATAAAVAAVVLATQGDSSGAPAIAAKSAQAQAGAAADSAPVEGPALVEAKGEELPAHPEKAEALAVAAPLASALASAPAPAALPRRHKLAQAVAPKASSQAAARAKDAAKTDRPVRDPDAELVAAIMARMESPKAAGSRDPRGKANDQAGTIASLVRECDAMADGAGALACRRRICDGYWGKAQACPKAMAPPVIPGATASSR